jgi:outer membrane protein assembly factor BamB
LLISAILVLPAVPARALPYRCGEQATPATDESSADANAARERWRVVLPEVPGLALTLANEHMVVAAETSGGCVIMIGALHGIDPASGSQRWVSSDDTRGAALDTPLGIGDSVYVIGQDRDGGAWVAAIDAATGELRWRFSPDNELDGETVFMTAEGGDDDTVIVSRTIRDAGEALLALDAATGTLRWSAPVGETFVRDDALDAVAGRVYAVDGAVNGTDQIVMLDLKTGGVAWHVPAPDAGEAALVATRDEGLIVAAGSRLALISATDGTSAWTATVPAAGATSFVQFAVGGDPVVALVRGQGGATATGFAIADGRQLWSGTLDAVSPFGRPSVVGQRLILNGASLADGVDDLVAVDLATGAIAWKVDAPSILSTATGHGAVYATDNATGASRLRSFARADGAERWTLTFPDLIELRVEATVGDMVYLIGHTLEGSVLIAVRA